MLHILASGDAEPPASSARAAIVTVVIGETYQETWRQLCVGTWRSYADRLGFDIIVYAARIDEADAARSPAWQKLLILNRPWAQRYERIVWLDSDIIINEAAPDILEFAGPPEKIGICVASGRLSAVEGQVYLERLLGGKMTPQSHETAWRQAQREVYRREGLPPMDLQFNTGVMVLSPRHHNTLLLDCYRRPEVSRLYEQPYLSQALLNADLAYEMNPRFNWGVTEPFQLYFLPSLKDEADHAFIGRVLHTFVRAELRTAYFLHFYGAMGMMQLFAGGAAETRAQAA